MKTNLFSILLLISALVSCSESTTKDKTTEYQTSDGLIIGQDANFKIIELSKPTIVSHLIDSIGFDQLLEKYGEDAETIYDDLMWYNYQMNEMADSLGVPVEEYKEKNIVIKYGNITFKHVQDTMAGPETHFYFDGKTIKKYNLLELMDIIGKVEIGQ